MAKKCVVKRGGREEEYDERKVYGSVYAACSIVSTPEKKCEETAKKVSGKVTRWVKSETKKKKCVGSKDIFKMAARELRKLNKDAAYMYETHRDVN